MFSCVGKEAGNARLRNLLVHVYWTIDYGQVYDLLQTRLNDLRQFSAAITRLL